VVAHTRSTLGSCTSSERPSASAYSMYERDVSRVTNAVSEVAFRSVHTVIPLPLCGAYSRGSFHRVVISGPAPQKFPTGVTYPRWRQRSLLR
jgi:hypothetical protein